MTALKELPPVIDRAVRFLKAAPKSKTLPLLMQCGFTQEDLNEGWSLLQAAIGNKLAEPKPSDPAPDVLTLLDEWENHWFPLIQASLRRRFPKVEQALFLNLNQTEGPALLISLGTLHQRLQGLSATTNSTDGQAALDLLAKRGLTADEIAKLGALLSSARTIDPAATTEAHTEADKKAAQQKALQDLEDYLDEWGTIARKLITNRTLLRQLGLLSWRNDPEPEPK